MRLVEVTGLWCYEETFLYGCGLAGGRLLQYLAAGDIALPDLRPAAGNLPPISAAAITQSLYRAIGTIPLSDHRTLRTRSLQPTFHRLQPTPAYTHSSQVFIYITVTHSFIFCNNCILRENMIWTPELRHKSMLTVLRCLKISHLSTFWVGLAKRWEVWNGGREIILRRTPDDCLPLCYEMH